MYLKSRHFNRILKSVVVWQQISPAVFRLLCFLKLTFYHDVRMQDCTLAGVWLFTEPHRAIPDHTGPHRARTGPEMTDYFTSTTNWKAKDELIIRNWLMKWTLIDARDELVTDVFNVSCLFSWSPSTVGSLLCLNSTRNSRRSEIISHFRLGTGPVRFGAVNSHTPLADDVRTCSSANNGSD